MTSVGGADPVVVVEVEDFLEGVCPVEEMGCLEEEDSPAVPLVGAVEEANNSCFVIG